MDGSRHRHRNVPRCVSSCRALIVCLCRRRLETGAGSCSRSRGWKGQVTDNAPSRSSRRSGHPILAIAALRLRGCDRDLICGEHYGQRLSKSAATTGRTDGSTDQRCSTVKNSLANREPSTDGYEPKFQSPLRDGESGSSFGHSEANVGNRLVSFRYTLSSGRRRCLRLTVSYDPQRTSRSLKHTSQMRFVGSLIRMNVEVGMAVLGAEGGAGEPGVAGRRASTQVQLRAGQTLVIGGLLTDPSHPSKTRLRSSASSRMR